jgi:tetratricopeptide (TPR) repeat protein
MLTSQKVVAMPYKLQLVEEVCRFVQERDLPDHLPVIRAYYRVYCLFAQEDAFPDFIELKKLIIHYESFFERMILDELYQYAINYCNLQIMKNPEIYVPEALNLYIMAIESGLMVNNGYLSPWNFKNVIKLSLILKQYDQTEQLILKYSQLLDPAFREDALHYNLAELFYHTERYDSAMSHLNQVEFTDVHYNLGAKVMLAKIYQHEGAYDALESLLHAFRSYLNRNKVIANDVRRIYLNFIYWLTRIIRSADGRRDGLREKIEQTKLLTEKNWLISLIAK